MPVATIRTFVPPPDARGDEHLAFEGNHRRGELRGIIKINQDVCVGCDTCRKVCMADAIDGSLGVAHKIRVDACVNCGQCLINCPFGSIEQMSFVDLVLEKLADPRYLVVAHPSPSVRVSIAEEFGGEPGELRTTQLQNALEKAGFAVHDVNLAADHTIIEEGNEFVKKVQYWVLGERGEGLDEMANYPLPHFSSCCPAWIKKMETFHAHVAPHVSTTKPPIPMGGALSKTWAAEKIWKRDPRDIFMVSTTPCTAKIFEASRPEYNAAWRYHMARGTIPADTPSFPDIDAVLTCRDLAELFRRKGINPLELPVERELKPMETYTGGSTIFGYSGGTFEGALRTAYYALSGKDLDDPNIVAMRAEDNSLLEVTVPVPVAKLGGKPFELKICVVNGAMQNLNDTLKRVLDNRNRYHLVEVMACPGGCVNGGGQPVQPMGTSWLSPALPLPLKA